MGVLDDITEPVPVEYLPLTSIYYIKLSIPKENCETTITENIAYSLGVRIFMTNKRKYNVTIINVDGTVKSLGAYILSLGSFNEIVNTMAVITIQSRILKNLPVS